MLLDAQRGLGLEGRTDSRLFAAISYVLGPFHCPQVCWDPAFAD